MNGRAGYFGMLSIDPAWQRRGLGARLIGEAEEFCRTAGCREMELQVVNLREELPPYYRRFGFSREAARRLDYPPPTNPDRLLARELAPGAFEGVEGMVRRWLEVF